MGPSMIVDGEDPAEHRAVADDLASMGPSMIVDGEVETCGDCRTRRQGFNGAVDDRRRRGSRRTAGLCRPRRFNGAVDDRRRRGHRRPADHRAPDRASMGPSMIVDGEAGLRRADRRRAIGFNGAVDDRRRRGRDHLARRARSMCFNGAVDDRRRRARRRTILAPRLHASMGPSMIVDGERQVTGPPRAR